VKQIKAAHVMMYPPLHPAHNLVQTRLHTCTGATHSRAKSSRLRKPPTAACLYPQGTFTDDAVIVALGVYCGNFEGADENRAFLSVVFAYSKKALYTKPPEDGCNIYAATYFPATSWYRSVPPSGQALVEAKFKPFNNYVQPARPQDYDDVMKRPMLVMKVKPQSWHFADNLTCAHLPTILLRRRMPNMCQLQVVSVSALALQETEATRQPPTLQQQRAKPNFDGKPHACAPASALSQPCLPAQP
jgi:hypothetical protein